MKLIKVCTLLMGLCMANTSFAQLTKFSMVWVFCDADGSNERAANDYCMGGTIYVKNKSLYNFNPGGVNVPAIAGDYRVFKAAGNANIYHIIDIPANVWYYGQVYAINLPTDVFNYTGASNLRIKYSGAGVSTYLMAGTDARLNDLQTRTVNISAGPDISVCSGTPISVTPTGASSYSWSPALPTTGTTFFSPTTTTYTVTGTTTFSTLSTNPKGTITCSATDAMTITVNPLPMAIIQRITLCTGDPLPILSAPAGMASYSWKRNGTTLFGQTTNTLNTAMYGYGTYSYTITNTYGCSTTASMNVNLHSSAYVNVDSTFSSLTSNAGAGLINIDVTANNSGCEHQWILYNSNANGDLLSWAISSFWSTSPSYTFANLPTGQYFVVVHSTRCSPCNEVKTAKRTFYETRRMPLSSGNDQDVDFQIFPNPSTGLFTFTLANPTAGQANVVDITGKSVYNLQLKENVGTYEIDLSSFPKGVYVVNITAGGSLQSKKVVLR